MKVSKKKVIKDLFLAGGLFFILLFSLLLFVLQLLSFFLFRLSYYSTVNNVTMQSSRFLNAARPVKMSVRIFLSSLLFKVRLL